MDWNAFHESIREWYHIEDEKTVKTFDLGSIREITATELLYDAPDGTVGRIDLAECEANFEAANGPLVNYNGEKLRCVGGRCFGHDRSFYEFFTAPHTRFSVTYRYGRFERFLKKIGIDWSFQKRFSAFYAIQKKLNEFHLTAIDLN